LPVLGTKSDSSTIQPTASCYTDWAIVDPAITNSKWDFWQQQYATIINTQNWLYCCHNCINFPRNVTDFLQKLKY
jgi:hypothetical protein